MTQIIHSHLVYQKHQIGRKEEVGKVNLCEAYQCSLHEPVNGKDQMQLIIFQYQLTDKAKNADKVQQKVEQLVQSNIMACNMNALPKLGIDWLAELWNTECNMI